MTMIVVAILGLLALLGLPLFLVLGAGALSGYAASGSQLELYFASFYRQVAGNPIYLAIPLFTLTGYLLAESRAPERLVRISRAALGWLPGGLAIVALVTCAVFTAFTGASGVTIVALGGLLLPALLKDGYPQRFSMGLLTSSGSRGILFPPSLPLIVYAMIAGMTLQNIDADTLAEMRRAQTGVEVVEMADAGAGRGAGGEPAARGSVDDQIAAALAEVDGAGAGAGAGAGTTATKPGSVDDQIAAALAEVDGADSGAGAAGENVDRDASQTQPAAAVAVVATAAVSPESVDDAEPFMQVTVDRLFVAGAVPGLMALLMIAFYAGWFGRKHKVPRTPFRIGELLRATRDMAWEVPVPFIVVGGVLGGFLTAVEAAAFAAAWVFVVEVFVYRDVPFKRLAAVFRESMVLVGGILLILMSAQALTNFFIDVEIPQKLFGMVKSTISSPLTFLLILNVFLLVVGMLMDIFSAIMVVVPIIAPVALYYGINPVHLGIIMLTNLEIGFNTPPVGVNLFVGSLAFRRPIVELVKAVVPYLLIGVIALILITYVPGLSLWLIQAFNVK